MVIGDKYKVLERSFQNSDRESFRRVDYPSISISLWGCFPTLLNLTPAHSPSDKPDTPFLMELRGLQAETKISVFTPMNFFSMRLFLPKTNQPGAVEPRGIRTFGYIGDRWYQVPAIPVCSL